MHRSHSHSSLLTRPPVRLLAWVVSAILLLVMLPAELTQPAAAQEDGLTYSVTVRKHECQVIDGFDPYASSLELLLETCGLPHEGVPFTLSTDNPNYPGGGRNSGDDGGSDAVWSGIPLNSTFTVQESIPDGFGLPMIACLAYASPFDASGGFNDPGFNFGEGSVSAFVPDTYSATPYISCHWFNIPLAQNVGNGDEPNGEQQNGDEQEGEEQNGQLDGSGTITIQKYSCWSDGATLLNLDQATLREVLGDICTAGYPEARFQIDANGEDSYTVDGDGIVSIEGFAGGTVRITELQPHWPHPLQGVVICTVTDAGGQVADESQQELVGGNAYTFDLQPGHSLHCDWYNVFLDATIISKYACPDDADYREPPVQELTDYCQPATDVAFVLNQEGGLQDSEQETGGESYAAWVHERSQSADDYETTVEELDAGGYPHRSIYCTTAMPGQYPVVTYAATTEETSFTYDHEHGSQVACAWFNIPAFTGENGQVGEEGEEDYGTVAVRKYVCDEVYPVDGDWEDWQAACSANPAVAGYAFQLTNNADYDQTNSTNDLGQVNWGEVPAGPLTIVETEYLGYQTGAIFCGESNVDEPTDFEPPDWSENSAQVDLQPAYFLGCLWFNVPLTQANGQQTGENVVRVSKYVCGEAYPENGAVDDWQAACTNSLSGSGYTFTLTDNAAYSEQMTTDESGTVVWTGTPNGELTLTESPAPGYRTGAVFCGHAEPGTEPEPVTPQAIQGENSSGFDRQDGYDTACYWFNVPVRPVTIELYKFLCQPGYDESSLSKEYLEGYCSPEANISFLADGPNDGGGIGITDVNGYAAWEGQPSGEYQVYEDERPGYRPFRVYCNQVAIPNGPVPYEEVPLSEWSIHYDIEPGATLTCYWFNVPYEEVGKVHLYKYVCDSALDETSLSYDYLRSSCADPHEGVRYDATWSDGSTDWQETDENGFVEWEGVPIGGLTIYETVPPDYRLVRVYCNHYREDVGPAPDEYNNVLQGTNQMMWGDLWTDYVLECHWFNVEHEDTGYGWVTINKYVCPEGYDPVNADSAYHHSFCQDPHDGVQFSLTRESDQPLSGTVGEDGTLSWPDVQDGALVIVESLPPGYLTVYIECATYPREGSPTSYESVPFSEGRTMSYHLQEGYALTCYWFDAPYEEEYGTVTVYKYACEEGYEHDSLSKSYLDTYCVDPHPEVDYDLSYEHEDARPMTTSSSGEAIWEEVYGGSLHLYEHVPEGYFILRVYCSAYPASGGPGAYEEAPVHEGTSIYYHLPPGYSLTCYWYNAPVVGGWIEITKYACPADYDPAHANSLDYESTCHQRMPEVEYALDPHDESAGSETGETESSGYLRFEPLAYGAYYDVVETYPEGYNAAVVYCTRYTPHWGSEGPWERFAVSAGAIAVSLHEGEYLRCRWYNLQEEHGVNIRLTKYACVDEAWEYSREELFAECDEWMPNVRFYVNVGYDRISGVTSTQGEAAWEGVPAGLIRIEETPPEGYGNRVRVFCRVVQGDQAGEWESATVYEGIAIEYGMAAGNTLDCSWYNFPVDETGATVIVYKYHCHPNAGHASTSLHSMKSTCVPLAGMRLTLAAPGQQGISRITGEEGIAAWQGVPAGEIAIGEQHHYGYGTPIVYCAVGSETPERVVSGGGSIEYALEEGDALRCDWFNVSEVSSSGTGQGGGVIIINNSSSSSSSAGSSSTSGGIFGGAGVGGGQGTTPGGAPQGAGPATLTIIKYVCPSGIDLEDPEVQPSVDCEATEEPVSFNLRLWDEPADEEGTTQQSAPPDVDTVTFSSLEADEYILTELPAEEADVAWAFVLNCESSLGETDSTRFYPLAMTRENLSLHLTLYAGERLTCHWYNVPSGGAMVSLTVYECPGQIANPAQCDIASAPHTVEFAPTDPMGEIVTVETGPSGTAETELGHGAWAVEDTGGNTCLVDSNVIDDSNNLVIDSSVPVEVVVYTCAA